MFFFDFFSSQASSSRCAVHVGTKNDSWILEDSIVSSFGALGSTATCTVTFARSSDLR